MTKYIILFFLFINTSLSAQYFKIFDSFKKDNFFHFVKELDDNRLLFEYFQYAPKATTRFFEVDKDGEISNWKDFEVEGYHNVVFKAYFQTENGIYFICNGLDDNLENHILSIKLDGENYVEIDAVNIGDAGIIHVQNFFFDKSKRKMIFSLIGNNGPISEYVYVEFDDKGKIIDSNNITDFPSNYYPANDFSRIPNSPNYYFSNSILLKVDSQMNVIKQELLNEKTASNLSFAVMALDTVGTDTTVTFLGNYTVDDFLLNSGVKKYRFSGDSIIEIYKNPNTYSFSKQLFDQSDIYIDKKGNHYFAFLDGLIQPSGSYEENTVVVQKLSSDLKELWTYELQKENTTFFLSGIHLCSDGNILVVGRAMNYYGNNITNGFYLKLSPKGQIITKTTFPLSTQTEISVFPNPVKDHIILSSDYKKKADFILYNSLGQKVFSKETMMDNTRIDLPNNLVKGAYLYQILDRTGGLLSSGKLVLER